MHCGKPGAPHRSPREARLQESISHTPGLCDPLPLPGLPLTLVWSPREMPESPLCLLCIRVDLKSLMLPPTDNEKPKENVVPFVPSPEASQQK